MKETPVTINFDSAKLAALQFATQEKDISIEGELKAQLQKLYERSVPANVRAFVDFTGGSTEERPTRRQRENKPKPQQTPPAQSTPYHSPQAQVTPNA